MEFRSILFHPDPPEQSTAPALRHEAHLSGAAPNGWVAIPVGEALLSHAADVNEQPIP